MLKLKAAFTDTHHRSDLVLVVKRTKYNLKVNFNIFILIYDFLEYT